MKKTNIYSTKKLLHSAACESHTDTYWCILMYTDINWYILVYILIYTRWNVPSVSKKVFWISIYTLCCSFQLRSFTHWPEAIIYLSMCNHVTHNAHRASVLQVGGIFPPSFQLKRRMNSAMFEKDEGGKEVNMSLFYSVTPSRNTPPPPLKLSWRKCTSVWFSLNIK